MICFEQLNKEINKLKSEKENVIIDNLYLYMTLKEPVNNKKFDIIKNNDANLLIAMYNEAVNKDNLTYMALGVDYIISNDTIPYSRDLYCYKAA